MQQMGMSLFNLAISSQPHALCVHTDVPTSCHCADFSDTVQSCV